MSSIAQQPRCLLIFASADQDPYHASVTPDFLSTFLIRAGLAVEVARHAAEVTAERLAAADLIVLWTLFGPDHQVAYDRLYAQVGQGTSLLAIHTAIWSADAAGRSAALGGAYRGHPPRQPFAVAIDVTDHPIVAGVKPFTIADEAYQIDVCDDITILAHADSATIRRCWQDEGQTAPMLLGFDSWTRTHRRLPLVYVKKLGRGTLVNLALGHDRDAFAHPAFGRIMSQAVAWLLQQSSASRWEDQHA